MEEIITKAELLLIEPFELETAIPNSYGIAKKINELVTKFNELVKALDEYTIFEEDTEEIIDGELETVSENDLLLAESDKR